MVKALDLSSNGRVVRVGSNPTPGRISFLALSTFRDVFRVTKLRTPRNAEFIKKFTYN